MEIRRAGEKDLPGLGRLLDQVLKVHAQGRPDIFRAGTRKYTDDELREILADDTLPVFVAVREGAPDGEILGYAFCVMRDYAGSNNLQPIRTLYIDDLCVDESARGHHVGMALYQHVVSYARAQGCHNLTLNVWACNPSAQRFYEAMGMSPQKTCLEQML
ncbi:GNAT family N-acetyltransferase [Thermophilibacter immobilis]|jgi:ribosomal protein S18 acetylase RimI-like enzyme|uniref:GNAT family N-acetyltransferase n=1 Tax=Thermophilibacter immobilis TaxID=2779519 RepID=A0A7S7RTM8_9ACTN|nr:GNAT family N-acetyltransferase [Thermophilibacter immobilis]QOY60376.1 GNAT family N-acetyltransferase [Thermophilibacter immobilis]